MNAPSITSLLLYELLILKCGQQLTELRCAIDADNHEPGFPVRVLVHLLRRAHHVLVDFHHLAPNRAEEVRDRFDRLDGPEDLPGFELGAQFGELHIDDVTELPLSEVGNTHGPAVALHLDPFVFLGVPAIVRVHLASPRRPAVLGRRGHLHVNVFYFSFSPPRAGLPWWAGEFPFTSMYCSAPPRAGEPFVPLVERGGTHASLGATA